MAGIVLTPKEIELSNKWLNEISIGISDSTEFSENNQAGKFESIMQRKEVIISNHIDINNLSVEDCSEIIRLFWLIGQTLNIILK